MHISAAQRVKVPAHTPSKSRPQSRPLEQAKVAEAAEQFPTLQLSYLPQDPGMIPPQLGLVKADPSLKNERFQLSVGPTYPQVKPDAEGRVEITDLDDPRFDSSNCFYIANQTLEMAERYVGGTIDWSFQESLGHPMLIKPHAGKDLVNAYYNPQAGSLNFFSYLNTVTGERERTGMSRDIVAHETGHSILDGIRPNYLGSMSVGTSGFHESFADMTAFLSSLNDPHVVEALRTQTKGDLSKPNLVSGMAEQLGAAIDQKGPLREMVNNYKYAHQAFLPYIDRSDPGRKVGTECHAYANLFNGAFYELFLNFYNQASAQAGTSFEDAVGQARDKVGKLLFRAVEMSPVGEISLREAAQAFLRADLLDNQAANHQAISQVFLQRKILRPEDAIQVAQEPKELPNLRWSKGLQQPEKAENWLEQHRQDLKLAPKLELEYDRVRSNNQGEHFLSFKTHRDTLLQGSEFKDFEGAQLRNQGGILLGFSPQGKLMTMVNDPISDNDVEDTVAFFRESLARQQVSYADGQGQNLSKDNPPKLQVESVLDQGQRVLRRGGVI